MSRGYPVDFRICLHDLRLEEKHLPYDLTVTVNGDVLVAETGLTELGLVQRTLVTHQPHSAITALVSTPCGDYHRSFSYDASFAALRGLYMHRQPIMRPVHFHYIPVTGITNIPKLLHSHTQTELDGKVDPTKASRQIIHYDLSTTTNAALQGTTLTTAEAGNLILLCVVPDGMAPGKDYTRPFNIPVIDFIPVDSVDVYMVHRGKSKTDYAVVNDGDQVTTMCSDTKVELSFDIKPSNASIQDVEWAINTEGCIVIQNDNILTVTLEKGRAFGGVTINYTLRGALTDGSDYTGSDTRGVYSYYY